MTKTASPAQQNLINNLTAEILAIDPAAVIPTQTGTVSQLISALFDAKRAASQTAHKAKAAVENDTIDHGFHKITVDGQPVILKVVKAKNPANRPYAYIANPTARRKAGRWVYAGRRHNDHLSADTLITATQAADFGHAHGWCIVCAIDLEDPESVHDGIGPRCYKNITGLTKAQARNAGSLAGLPADVQQAVRGRKAAQKANLSAEKDAEALAQLLAS